MSTRQTGLDMKQQLASGQENTPSDANHVPYTERTCLLVDPIGRASVSIKQGYKIFALGDQGYIWHFQLSSRQNGIGELVRNTELIPTGSMVLRMAQLLPKTEQPYFVLFLDGYFTSMPLFSKLCAKNIDAVGTKRSQGTEFPASLATLRQQWSTKLD
jgi:Transposase IS4